MCQTKAIKWLKNTWNRNAQVIYTFKSLYSTCGKALKFVIRGVFRFICTAVEAIYLNRLHFSSGLQGELLKVSWGEGGDLCRGGHGVFDLCQTC